MNNKNDKQTNGVGRFLVTIYFAAIFFMGYSASAYAYLEPGSGSAIISVIAATIGSLWYSFKSMFYSLRGHKSDAKSSVFSNKTIVLFSEGKAYWGTFRPLVEELIKQKIPFRYRTLDLHDPALTIESPFMQSKRLSSSIFSLALLAKTEAPIMVSTTPNIGCEGYPLQKPKNVQNLVHVFHHIGDISSYKRHALDFYDSAILVGDFQTKSIREIENLRGLKPKSLITLGLPYLDQLFKNRPDSNSSIQTRKTILIGSSWGQKGCLQTYGIDFIKSLSDAGFNLIVRPHPQSFLAEPEFISQCMKETKGDSVTWDSDVSPSKSMHKSDLLISDTSSLRFDYAFLYEKPIITLEIPRANLAEYEGTDLAEHWHESAATEIGVVVNKQTIKNLSQIVADVLSQNTAKDLQQFRSKTVKNFGNSAPHIIEYLKTIQTKQES